MLSKSIWDCCTLPYQLMPTASTFHASAKANNLYHTYSGKTELSLAHYFAESHQEELQILLRQNVCSGDVLVFARITIGMEAAPDSVKLVADVCLLSSCCNFSHGQRGWIRRLYPCGILDCIISWKYKNCTKNVIMACMIIKS